MMKKTFIRRSVQTNKYGNLVQQAIADHMTTTELKKAMERSSWICFIPFFYNFVCSVSCVPLILPSVHLTLHLHKHGSHPVSVFLSCCYLLLTSVRFLSCCILSFHFYSSLETPSI